MITNFPKQAMHIKLILFTTLFCCAFAQEEESITTLHTNDDCGNYSMAQVCISPSVFKGLKHEYKSMNIWIEDDTDFHYPGIRKKYRKPSTKIELGYEFRIEGKTLFHLTDMIGPTIPAYCTIEESPFFCLNDSIGTVRGLKGSCVRRLQSQLIKKAFSRNDSLYTYKLLETDYTNQIVELVFNTRFEVKQLVLNTQGGCLVGPIKGCVSPPLLLYK